MNIKKAYESPRLTEHGSLAKVCGTVAGEKKPDSKHGHMTA